MSFSRKKGAEYYGPYVRALESQGAEAVLLPPETERLEGVDGLLLPGGWDVDPELYGEEPAPELGSVDRELDDAEIRLFRQARGEKLPVLGICRGQQVINVALGGKLHQHVEEHEVRQFGRAQLAHPIEVEADSELGRAAAGGRVEVNSLHHQSVSSLGNGLRATARSGDGVVEGVETDDGLVVAVQCHPEELAGELAWARSLFARFVERARKC